MYLQGFPIDSIHVNKPRAIIFFLAIIIKKQGVANGLDIQKKSLVVFKTFFTNQRVLHTPDKTHLSWNHAIKIVMMKN